MEIAQRLQTPDAAQMLGELGALLGTPVGADMERFCEAFAPNLRHFGELGVHLPERWVGVLTLGCGKAFGEEVAAYLGANGFSGEACERARELQRQLDDWMLVRLASDGCGASELGLYFRRAMPMTRALELLHALGTSPRERDALSELGGLLGATRVGIFGARLSPVAKPLYQVYLHAYETPGAPLVARLIQAFGRFGIPPARWRRFLRHLHGRPSAPTDVFVSLVVADDPPHDSLSLSYFHMDLAEFERSLAAGDLLAEGELRPTQVGERLGVASAEHVGLRFEPDRVSWTCYVSPALHRALAW